MNEKKKEMVRTESKNCFRDYVKNNCDEKGNQESNLTKGESIG